MTARLLPAPTLLVMVPVNRAVLVLPFRPTRPPVAAVLPALALIRALVASSGSARRVETSSWAVRLIALAATWLPAPTAAVTVELVSATAADTPTASAPALTP